MKKISKIHYQLYSTYSRIEWNQMKKIHAIEICMHTNYGGQGLSNFRDKISFQIWPISLSDHGLYPWRSKHRIKWNRLKKFMPVDVDKICMHTYFKLMRPLQFQSFQIWPNFPFEPWTIVYGGQNIKLNVIDSINLCK